MSEKTLGQRLPGHLIEKGLALAKGAVIFGVPIEELGQEELLAVAALGWNAEREAREEGMRQLRVISGMR